MKRNPLIMLIVVVVSMCFISEYALAAMDSNHVILLKKELKYDTWDPEEEGRRVPSKPISCVITPSGIIIDGVNTAEIYLIVVCDINGGRIYEFTDESDFIEFLYGTSLDFDLEIHLHISDYTLIGYV